MKLIVQIPCLNEEKTLPLVLNSIPKKIPGVDKLETMIIDDGSTDKTIAVAKQLGVDHIIRHKSNKGLAMSFSDGIHACLRLGADIIVNTDGDNQYNQADIPKLIKPILKGEADIVVGNRQTSTIKHFSKLKKGLQRLGSHLVRIASGTNIPDAPSGFRAYSRSAAMAINIVTTFSYVTETIIQAGKKRLAITHVPIRTNPKTRESRLFKSTFEHVRKSTVAIFRSYAMYEPMRIFLISGVLVFGLGLIPYFRYTAMMIFWGEAIGGHLQSLILGAVFIILGFMLIVMGVIADLLGINRKLLEDSLYRLKKIEYDHILKNDLVVLRRMKKREQRKGYLRARETFTPLPQTSYPSNA
jgi:glycosyltransferase involved in cell wall biosynthesis